MFGDDVMGNYQSQSSTRLFSGKHRLKEVLNHIGCNTRSRIAKNDLNLSSLAGIASGNGQFTSSGHGVTTIVHQIKENLVQAVALGHHRRQILFEVDRRCDIARLQHWANQLDQLMQDFVDVSESEGAGSSMSSFQQTFY